MKIPQTASWKEWHIPLSLDQVTLAEAVESLRALGAQQDDIPLMVQLVENPKYDLPGFDLFHGSVTLEIHDYIHILLGRGLFPLDEAFVIGFTMGSTNRVTTTEERFYSFVSKYLYPKVYRFDDRCLAVFKDATRLGFISDCHPLDLVDFKPHLDRTLREARESIGIETDLLRAYYGVEKRRYPDSKESQRLL